MKLHKLFLTLLAGTALLAGCAQEDPVNDPQLAVDVNPSVLNFGGEADETEVEVTAQAAWTAVVPADAEWITVNPTSGAVGVTKVKISIAAGGEKARSAEVVFKAGADKKIVSIRQESGGVKYGTKENPFSPSQAYDWVAENLGAGANSNNEVYIRGKVCRIIAEYVADDYGNANFFISEDGKESEKAFQCYRCLYVTPEGATEGVKYSDTTKPNIHVGDEVLVYGLVTNYQGNTPETVQNKAWLLELKAGSSPVLSAAEPEVKVAADAKEAKFAIKPVNVSKWTAKTAETYDWITSITESGEGEADLVVALTENTTDAAREAKIIVSAEGADDLTLTLIQKAPEAVTTLYKISDFVAAEVNADKWYQISGIVTEIVNGQYGNVYLRDGSGAEIYVYGITATQVEKNDKSFGRLDIKVGDWVTINATRGKFADAKDPRQVEQAAGGYLVAHKKVVPATNKEFLAAAVSSDQYYQLTGTVESIVMDKNDNTKVNAYGNLYIKDEAGDQVYIYGLVEYPLYYFDESKNAVKFSNTKTFESLGVKVGDKVTVNGFRSAYNNEPQMIEAWLVKKEAGTTPDPDPQPGEGVTIKTADEFVAWAADGTKSATLTADITLPAGFTPATVTADFDGGNKTITVTNQAGPVFASTTGAVKNVVFAGSFAAADATAKFHLAPIGKSTGAIENVINKATVTYTGVGPAEEAGVTVAGIVCEAYGPVKNCKNQAKVSADGAGKDTWGLVVGGIIGFAGAAIEDCENSGEVSLVAGSPVGRTTGMTEVTMKYNPCPAVSGIVVYAVSDDTHAVSVRHCNNSGKITMTYDNLTESSYGASRTGVTGIVSAGGCPIADCTNTGDIYCNAYGATRGVAIATPNIILHPAGIHGSDYYAKNLTASASTIDQDETTITGCTNSGHIYVDSDCVKSNSAVGGISGWPAAENAKTVVSKISNCTNTGDITVKGVLKVRVGGVAGGTSFIEGCKSTGNILVENADAGSIAGLLNGFHTQAQTLKDCEVSGKIESKVKLLGIGGLCGGIGNAENTFGENCKVNATLVGGGTEQVGLIVGNLNDNTKKVTVGTPESPVRVSGSVDGVTATADNFQSLLHKASNYKPDVHTFHAVFGN